MADSSDATIASGARPPEFHDAFPLERLFPDPDNHRRGGLGDLTSLTEDIARDGVDSPLRATPHPRAPEGMLLIVYGHRRHAAATAAGRDTVPVIIAYGDNPLGGLSDDLVDKQRARENLERADLTPSEEAWIYQSRAIKTGDSDGVVATFYGRSQAHVTKRRALLRLPEEVLAAVDKGGKDGGIGSGDAYALSQLMVHPDGGPIVIELVRRFVDGSLGVSLQQAAADEKRRLGIVPQTVGRRGNRPAEQSSLGDASPAVSAPTSALTVPSTEDVAAQEPLPTRPMPAPRGRQTPSYRDRDRVTLRPVISGETYRLIVDHRIHGGRGRPGFVHFLADHIEELVQDRMSQIERGSESSEAIPEE